MNNPNMDNSLPPQEDTGPSLPWSLMDTWIGLGLLVMILVAFAVVALVFRPLRVDEAFIVVFTELIFIFPVLIVLAVRRADYKLLGFRRFNTGVLEIGFGLVVASYFITILNNSIFLKLGISTQADEIVRLLHILSSPYSFIFTAVILAPIVEETFFRGFLFGGFRQRYGYQKAALLSSAIFAAAHFQWAALIPTFMLGYIFTYLYRKSNSILPGMLMHFAVNAFGIITIFISQRAGLLTPR
jgi:membrane protease YdiL (CAAX protease family)